MSRHLRVPEEVRRFAFAGDECLYRDHFGRRVVADVEGDGSYRVEHSTAALLIVRGDETTGKFTGTYEKGLVVLALSEGDVLIRTRCGSEATSEPPSTVCDGFAGSGWVVASEGPFEVDGRNEIAPDASEGFPVPFFRNATGRGLRILEAATRCSLIDSFSIDDQRALKERRFAVQNMSAISELASAYANGSPYTASVASHLNVASWRMSCPHPVAGLLLRKLYDRFHGRQRARVTVNGRFAGWWYEPGQNREARWAVSDFGIPGSLIQDGTIEIAIDPPAGSPLWSVSEIQVFAVT